MDRRTQIFDRAKEFKIEIRMGQSVKDQLKKAIHLLNPTLDDLDDAVDQCIDEHLSLIYIYNKQTWCSSRRNQLFNY